MAAARHAEDSGHRGPAGQNAGNTPHEGELRASTGTAGAGTGEEEKPPQRALRACWQEPRREREDFGEARGGQPGRRASDDGIAADRKAAGREA